MKKSVLLLAIIKFFISFGLYSQTATAPAAGDGSSGNPFQIATWQNLYWISQNSAEWGHSYIQTANIDFNSASPAINTWDSGAGWTPIGNATTKFTGSYNGQYFTITGLYINRSSTDNIGLFGYTNGATISNIGLIGGSVIGKNYVGTLVGANYGATPINNSYNTGTVSGSSQVGGLVGINNDGTITSSYNTGTIGNGVITSSGSYYVGGLVGHNNVGTIRNCYSIGAISGYYGIGGLVGYNNTDGGTVDKCYSTGYISAYTSTIGGLYRYGGLVGDCCSGTVSDSYWDTDSSGTTSSPSGKGTGKTTAEMKSASTFLGGGWDFTLTGNIWAMNGSDNNGYPFLRWQGYTSSHIWLGGTSDWATTGNWSESSLPTASKNVIVPNLTNDPIIAANSSGDCKNLSVESGATFTIQSTASNNGSLMVSGTSTGSITYNRYVTGVDKWHLISSPVGAQDINAFVVTNAANAIATSGSTYGLAPYNNSTPAWGHFNTSTIGSAGSFTAGKGYEVLRTSDGTVAFTGTVASSDVSIGITKNTNAWNLIGNPFPSSINGNSPAHATNNFLTVNTAAIDASYLALYVWDAASSAYLTVNHTYNSSSAFYMAPGQAFFVYSIAGGATVNFTEAMQTHQTGNIFKSGAKPAPSIKLIAERKEGTTSTNITYLEAMTTGLDPGYDAGLFSGGNNSFAVYTHLVGDNTNPVDFDIQCLPANKYDQIIPVGLNAPKNTEVVFRAETMGLPPNVPVYLEDKVTGTFTLLSVPGSFYTVTLSEQSQGIGRFFLHTQSAVPKIGSLDNETNIGIIPLPQNNIIRVIGDFGSDSQLAVFDLTGRKILNRKLNSKEVNDVEMGDLTNGVYVVYISSSAQKVSKKISWVKY